MKLQIHSFVGMSEDLDQAKQNLQKAQDRQKSYADRKRRDIEIQVGDEVLLSNQNFASYGCSRSSRKLGPLYCGPFQS